MTGIRKQQSRRIRSSEASATLLTKLTTLTIKCLSHWYPSILRISTAHVSTFERKHFLSNLHSPITPKSGSKCV